MQPQMQAAIKELADSLCIASNVLWQALLRQAKIDAFCFLSAAIALLCVTWCIARWYQREYHRQKGDIGDSFSFVEDMEPLYTIGCLLLVVITPLPALTLLYKALTAIVNPDYYALSIILSAIN